MERLTEKRDGKNVIPLRNAICGVNLPYFALARNNEHEQFFSGDAADRLAAYEDLEEQGRLVVLPCKVGDTVYPINADPNYEAKIIGAGIDNGGVWMEWAQYCENVDDPLELWDEEIFYISEIGKTVFLTRAEAEKAMEVTGDA